MKKVLCILFALLMCTALAVNVSAASHRLVDDADLLSTAEEAELGAMLDEVSKKHDVDIVVLTVDSIDIDPLDYAGNYFNSNGYGLGKEKSGVLLLRALSDAEGDKVCTIYTCAVGFDAITDSDVQGIFDLMESDINDEEYFDAFETFVEECDERIGDYIYDTTHFKFGKKAVIALIIGLVVAFIATSIMKGKLKSVHFQSAAANYVKAGSLKLTESRDTFLYSTVSRTAKPKNTSSGGGGSSRSGGGSRKM